MEEVSVALTSNVNHDRIVYLNKYQWNVKPVNLRSDEK